ncbi:hypothetical protein OGAPHI_002311 [Ogataea philodendri]|uniref:Uncharacterized protein n=1 Tax=Ogataea philodendri TaxID=1378263 RepID=A0A9P8PB03_9ASCO|nr:uncharacterized protein OGAPHI_002311 [Ogataea philodendri]KAH3668557.1 hypothetical protein OGAPHI_002311 [Ogataea philodendri]
MYTDQTLERRQSTLAKYSGSVSSWISSLVSHLYSWQPWILFNLKSPATICDLIKYSLTPSSPISETILPLENLIKAVGVFETVQMFNLSPPKLFKPSSATKCNGFESSATSNAGNFQELFCFTRRYNVLDKLLSNDSLLSDLSASVIRGIGLIGLLASSRFSSRDSGA